MSSLIQDSVEKYLVENNIEISPEILQGIIDAATKNISNDLLKESKKIAKYNHKELRKFKKRLHRAWKRPFRLAETIIEVSTEVAIDHLNDLALEESSKTNQVIALRHIHARVIMVSKECLILIENGYPDGALSRWRTLYELSVIALFLKEHNDEELAIRYIDHSVIQAYKDEKKLREAGNQQYTDEAFCELENINKELINKYDKKFAKDYGWANKYFKNKNVNLKEIAKDVSMDNLYNYFSFSSTYIHGNHKANIDRVSYFPNSTPILLLGPSNYGLALPIQNLVISLASISTTILSIAPNVDTLIHIKTLNELKVKTEKEALNVQRKIEEKEFKKSRKNFPAPPK